MWLRLGASRARNRTWKSVAAVLFPLYALERIRFEDIYMMDSAWTVDGILRDVRHTNLYKPPSCIEEQVYEFWKSLKLFITTGQDAGEVRYDPFSTQPVTQALVRLRFNCPLQAEALEEVQRGSSTSA